MFDMAELALDAYQDEAKKTDRKGKDVDIPFLGLFGEVGSLVSEVKKKQRDSTSYVGYAETVEDELGDVLWYLTAIASRAGVSLSQVAASPTDQVGTGNKHFTFADLQAQGMLPLQHPSAGFEATLIELGICTGRILDAHRSKQFAGDGQILLLGNIFHRLVRAADEAHVQLATAAQKNLEKTQDRWPETKAYPSLFDVKFVQEEQLPRSLVVDLFERQVNGKTYVIQRCGDVLIGDRVTDNNLEKDDYRFHDVFHYAFACKLGWSPVIRALMHRKRRSDPVIDETQDGARAILIEEGISTFVFGQAKQLQFFAAEKPGDLNFALLKVIRKFVAGYEPEVCPLWLWEEAILSGYECFRFLKAHRRGKLHVDLNNRKMTIGALT
jgi:NTP pyrophosphatase (non-canonical NTP hydrolase)